MVTLLNVSCFLSILRQGIHDLRVWPGKVADGDQGTPGKFSKQNENEMSKLAKVRNSLIYTN